MLLAKMSFDRNFDITAEVSFSFFLVYWYEANKYER